MLELHDITKVYKTKSENVVALNKVNLTFGETGMVFVTGKSGSGKTTLLNVVGGLDAFDGGDLVVKGRNFAEFKQSDFDDYRNTFIGFVFQEYNLLDEMSVEKNISLAMELQGSKKDVERINEILRQVDLEGLNNRRPSELSGGQKQRVAIARALVKNPKIILTDEPTGALDTNSGVQVMNLLKDLSRERLVIIVSHNMDLARAYADRIIEMQDGEVVRDYTLTRNEQSQKLHVKELPNKVLVKLGAELSDKDLTVLKAAVKQCKEIQIVDENNFYIEAETETVKTKAYQADDAKFIKGKLGFGNTLKMGLANLKIKPIRLVVTILLCAIAFSIFGLFDTMSVYNEARLTANTLKNSNVPNVVLTASYLESNGDEYKLSVDSEVVKQLRADTGLNFKGVYDISPTKPDETKSVANISKYYLTTKMSGVVEIENEAELASLNLSLSAGRLPTAYDEIAISNYYAMCVISYGYSYGDFVINADNCRNFVPADLVRDEPLVLTLDMVPYKIVGIVDVGKIDSKYDSILKDYANAVGSLKTDFSNYVNNSFCLYGFVKDGFVDNSYEQSQTMFQYRNSTYNYDFEAIPNNAQYFFNYDQFAKIGGKVLFIDQSNTTLSANDVLINIRYFKTVYASLIEEFTATATEAGNESDLKLFDENVVKLNTTKTTAEEKIEACEKLLNLLCGSTYRYPISAFMLDTKVVKRDTTRYDSDGVDLAKVPLENDTYKIVGFYTGVAPGVSATALVLTEDGIANLGVNMLQGSYNAVIAPSPKGTSQINKVVSLVRASEGLKFSSYNNVIAIITLNHDLLQEMSTLFLAASGVFAAFAIAMMANYISTSIANRHTQIGILRALGTTGVGVLLMFLVESLVIALINAVISNVVTALGSMALNSFFVNVLNVSIPLATYTFRQVGVITGLSLGVAVLASLVPIIKLSRKKPIETIRR